MSDSPESPLAPSVTRNAEGRRPAPLAHRRRRSSDAAFAIAGLDGRIGFCSHDFAHLFGLAAAQVGGVQLATLLPALPFNGSTPAFNLAFATFWGAQDAPLRMSGHTPHGPVALDVAVRRVDVAGVPLILAGIRPAGADGDDGLERFLAGAEARSEAVMVTDRAGRICYVNPAFERVTGYPAAEVIGQPSRLLQSGQHPADFYRRLWCAIGAGEEVRAVFINRRRDGSLFQEDKLIRPFVDARGRISHFVAISHSLSEPLKTAMLCLQHEAYRDPLTRLANRALFQDRMQQSIARAARQHERFAVVFVDLDGFKAINDRFGHAFGDRMLVSVAQCLLAAVRSDDTVARLGGDEFALILHRVRQPEDVRRICQQVLDAFSKVHDEAGILRPVHASLGVSLYPDDGATVDAMLAHADVVMYRAKAQGGDRVLFALPAE